jgi:hypothetical protein
MWLIPVCRTEHQGLTEKVQDAGVSTLGSKAHALLETPYCSVGIGLEITCACQICNRWAGSQSQGREWPASSSTSCNCSRAGRGSEFGASNELGLQAPLFDGCYVIAQTLTKLVILLSSAYAHRLKVPCPCLSRCNALVGSLLQPDPYRWYRLQCWRIAVEDVLHPLPIFCNHLQAAKSRSPAGQEGMRCPQPCSHASIEAQAHAHLPLCVAMPPPARSLP